MTLFANFISQLKNALNNKKAFIIFPKNALFFCFLRILFFEGFISSVVEIRPGKLIKVYLKYNTNGSPSIKKIKLLSSPGNSKHLQFNEISKLTQGVGLLIISTPKGLLTNHLCLKYKLGGTLLCFII
jgi:small subunit ribosomal protein S8